VIALCLSGGKPPAAVEDRLATATRLVEGLTGAGVPIEDIHVDPCVFPISTGPDHGPAVLEAVSRIRERFPGVHTSAGVSNVSFGLPVRRLLNEAFLVMLVGRGLDTAIIDPCDAETMARLAAAEALAGADAFCKNYLQAYRSGKLQAPEPAQASGMQQPAG